LKMSMNALRFVVFMLTATLLTACSGGFLVGLSVASQLGGSLIVAIVDSEVYEGIRASLQQYKEDVERSGFLLNITETDALANQTKEGVKACLQGFWRSGNQNVSGAWLIGDIPEAWYEAGSRDFPTDVYYMDLNGLWMDTDEDGIFDKHSGDSYPEIWVGRLKVSTVKGEEVALLNRYFEKNHLYRNHLSSIPWWRALLYMDDLGVVQGHDALTPLRYVAPQIVAVTSGAATNADDYKKRLQDEVGYQWLYLMSHGNASDHTFQIPSKETYYEWDGTVYSSDYETLNPRVCFYQLFVCSAGRYVEEDYLAGAAVFRNDYGLLAIASTSDAYTFPYNGFYRAMSEGEIIGAAFLQWLNNAIADYLRYTSTDSFPSNTLRGTEYEVLLHDTVIIGDPTLGAHIEDHNIRIAKVTAAMINASDVETLTVSFTVENVGDFLETFNATIHIDSDLVYQSRLTLEPKGNRTIAFSPIDASKYIWSDFLHHRIRAEISFLQGEFDVENNVCYEHFESKKIYRSLLMRLPEVIFAISGILFFGLMCWSFLRLLMSDRPLYHVQRGLRRVGVLVRAALLRRA